MRSVQEKCAVIAVSDDGLRTAVRLVNRGFTARVYAAENLKDDTDKSGAINWFADGVVALTQRLFSEYEGLVFVTAMGIAVRAIASHVNSKYSDPAVVTVDVGGRWAIATLSGHEGGANELASRIARYLHAEPVITTSTEAVKTLIAGIGCGKGVSAVDIKSAVGEALRITGHTFDELRLVVTVDAKEHEDGLLTFCVSCNLLLRVISREEIKNSRISCNESLFVKETLGIGAVAEPCALLGGSKTELILEKQAFNRVTVALAVERCDL